MIGNKYVTIMFVPDSGEPGRGWRVRLWLLRAIAVACVAFLIGVAMFFSFYGVVLSRAARTEELTEENERLRRYRYKVEQLEQNLNEAREIVVRLTELAGFDYTFPEMPPDSVLLAPPADTLGAIPPTVFHDSSFEGTLPTGLPVNGYISRHFELTTDTSSHPGIDIACTRGTSVVATGTGIVIYAGDDPNFGNLVVLKHNDSVTSYYAHNDTLLVVAGAKVPVGTAIARSGSSRTTTPHLHYQVRVHNQPINPLENLYAKETF